MAGRTKVTPEELGSQICTYTNGAQTVERGSSFIGANNLI